MEKIKHIISLGPGCGTARSLEKIGARSQAGPFDWVTTKNLKTTIELIETRFESFLIAANMYQSSDHTTPEVYYDLKNNIGFYHDFNNIESFIDQFSNVKRKYARRIDRFMLAIEEPTVFIREVNNTKELVFIENEFEYINKVIKGYNPKNEIIFVTRDIQLLSKKCKMSLIKAKKPIPRYLWGYMKNNIESYNENLYSKFIDPNIFSTNQRKQNLTVYKKKNTFYLFRKIHKKILLYKKTLKNIDRSYVHHQRAFSEYSIFSRDPNN